MIHDSFLPGNRTETHLRIPSRGSRTLRFKFGWVLVCRPFRDPGVSGVRTDTRDHSPLGPRSPPVPFVPPDQSTSRRPEECTSTVETRLAGVGGRNHRRHRRRRWVWDTSLLRLHGRTDTQRPQVCVGATLNKPNLQDFPFTTPPPREGFTRWRGRTTRRGVSSKRVPGGLGVLWETSWVGTVGVTSGHRGPFRSGLLVVRETTRRDPRGFPPS